MRWITFKHFTHEVIDKYTDTVPIQSLHELSFQMSFDVINRMPTIILCCRIFDATTNTASEYKQYTLPYLIFTNQNIWAQHFTHELIRLNTVWYKTKLNELPQILISCIEDFFYQIRDENYKSFLGKYIGV